VHQVSNVMAHDLVVSSNLTVVEFRNDKQRLWAGLVEHRLVRNGDGFRIARKRIDLVNSTGEIEGITVLL
jgi:3-phenylpropionate/cinnamic acid dioxygenase small subunit